MPAPTFPPFVLIPCDNRILAGHPYHALGRKYADAVRLGADCMPLIAPTGGAIEIAPYLAMADGILLTGSPANVHPSHFGQALHNPALPLDPERDSVTLPLVRVAIERGIPLLAICRGLQEINVAMGGSLYQAVHELPGKRDHRAPANSEPAVQYGPSHHVELASEGTLAHILGMTRFDVNSVHGQGIDRLADGLTVEAWAPDGLIEAVRIAAHPGFSLGVQWHPEWQVLQNPTSLKIFRAFGGACRAMQQRRLGASPPGWARAA
jgi:putative glutamine amidotransferase